MQFNLLGRGPSGKVCITKTSPPGQRCLQPVLSGIDDSSHNKLLLDEFSERQMNGSEDTHEYATSPEDADAPAPSSLLLYPEDTTLCVDMACSADKRVLVNGKLCDPGEPFPPSFSIFRSLSCQCVLHLRFRGGLSRVQNKAINLMKQ
jgi:hypothetical protein